MSGHKINKYSETGSPCEAPFWSLKYFVVLPQLIMQDSWHSSSISTHVIKSFPYQDFLRQASKKNDLKNRMLSINSYNITFQIKTLTHF